MSLFQFKIQGTVTDTYTYDAFGNLIAQTGTTPNDYLYSGERFDANSGFYYLRARYMNPESGRFLSRDSAEGQVSDPISELKSGGEDLVTIIPGRASLERVTHNINEPRHVCIEQTEDGADITLQIESGERGYTHAPAFGHTA